MSSASSDGSAAAVSTMNPFSPVLSPSYTRASFTTGLYFLLQPSPLGSNEQISNVTKTEASAHERAQSTESNKSAAAAVEIDLEAKLVPVQLEELSYDDVEVQISHHFVSLGAIQEPHSSQQSHQPLSQSVQSHPNQQQVVVMTGMTGQVTKVGKSIRHLSEGVKVVIGPIARACMDDDIDIAFAETTSTATSGKNPCPICRGNMESFCPDRRFVQDTLKISGPLSPSISGREVQGRVYAQHARVQGYFAIPLPRNMADAEACQRMAVGIRAYTALTRNGIKTQTSLALLIDVGSSEGVWEYTWAFAKTFKVHDLTVVVLEAKDKKVVEEMKLDHTRVVSLEEMSTGVHRMGLFDLVVCAVPSGQISKSMEPSISALVYKMKPLSKFVFASESQRDTFQLLSSSSSIFHALMDRNVSVSFNAHIGTIREMREMLSTEIKLPAGVIERMRPRVLKSEDLKKMTHVMPSDRFVLEYPLNPATSPSVPGTDKS